MLTGELPFNAPSVAGILMKQITEPAPDLRTQAAATPGRPRPRGCRCLEKDPQNRWPTADALRRALESRTRSRLRPPVRGPGGGCPRTAESEAAARPRERPDGRLCRMRQAPARGPRPLPRAAPPGPGLRFPPPRPAPRRDRHEIAGARHRRAQDHPEGSWPVRQLGGGLGRAHGDQRRHRDRAPLVPLSRCSAWESDCCGTTRRSGRRATAGAMC